MPAVGAFHYLSIPAALQAELPGGVAIAAAELPSGDRTPAFA
jgi:hypothetical protein